VRARRASRRRIPDWGRRRHHRHHGRHGRDLRAPSLAVGAYESSTSIFVLDEGADFMPSTLTLDVAGAGTYDASPGTPSFLTVGTFAHSYYVHFDPVGSGFATATGAVFFEPGENIVGIQILPASLDMTQVPPIPHPTPVYPTGVPTRGFEFLPGTDTVTIAPSLSSAWMARASSR
jgi:hypothetical protein